MSLQIMVVSVLAVAPEIPAGPGTFSIMMYGDSHVPDRASQAASIIRREANKKTLLLFPGDTLSPSPMSQLTRGAHMIDIHNVIGVEAACLGNHDFNLGLDALVQAIRKSSFFWLNSNVLHNGSFIEGTWPRRMFQKGGVNVGIFAVMYSMNNEAHDEGFEWADPIAAAREQVAALNNEGADVIVALTHQDWLQDVALRAAVPGIHIIVGGHDHEAGIMNETGKPIVKAEANWGSLWQLGLNYTADHQVHVLHTEQHWVQRQAKDILVQAVMDSSLSAWKEATRGLVGILAEPLDVREAVVRSGEARSGSFLADAIRWQLNATAGIINGGHMRSDQSYPAGRLDRNVLHDILPFGSTLVQISLNQRHLKRLVEASLEASCPEPDEPSQNSGQNGLLLHPSGFTYQYICRAPRKAEVVRLSIASLDGASIDDPEEPFTLGLHDYLWSHKLLNQALAGSALLAETPGFGLPLTIAVERYISRYNSRIAIQPPLDRRIVRICEDADFSRVCEPSVRSKSQ